MKVIGSAIIEKILILKNGFIGNVLILVGGTALSQILLFIAYPLISRLYQPGDFGAWSIIKSLSFIFSTVACWRYELSIVIPKRDEEAANLFIGSALIVTSMSFCLSIAVTFFGDELIWLLSIQKLSPWLWTLPVTLFLTGIYQSSNYWFTRRKKFSLLAFSRITQSAVTVLVHILLPVFILASSSTLITGTVLGQVTATGLILILILAKDGYFIIQTSSWQGVISGISNYRNFPLYVAPYSFVGNFQKQAILLLIGKFSSTNVVGLYAFASNIVSLPISLIASSLNQVFFTKVSQLIESESLSCFVNKILTLLILSTTPLFAFFIFNSTFIFTYLFGSRWSGAGNYAAWLSLTSFMLLYTSWLDRIYDVLGKQRLALMMEIIYDIVSIFCFWLTLVWQKEPLFSVSLYSSITVIYNFIWLLVTFRIAKIKLSGILKVCHIFIIILSIFSLSHLSFKYAFPPIFVMLGDFFVIIIYYIFFGLRLYKNREEYIDLIHNR